MIGGNASLDQDQRIVWIQPAVRHKWQILLGQSIRLREITKIERQFSLYKPESTVLAPAAIITSLHAFGHARLCQIKVAFDTVQLCQAVQQMHTLIIVSGMPISIKALFK